VVILAIMFFVNPSISLGLAFFATRDRDLVMMLRPFLNVRIRTKFTCDSRIEDARLGKDLLESLIRHIRQHYLSHSADTS
jgi:hypothetical protein